MTPAPLILLFFTSAPDLGFKPGYGLEFGLTHPNFELRLSGAHQPKYNTNTGYTYSSSLQLYPAWSVSPTTGFTCYGYQSVWSKHTCTYTYGLHVNTRTVDLVALVAPATQPATRTYLLKVDTTLTPTLFLHTSIDYTTPINAMGYTLGIGWKKSPQQGAKERRR